MNDKVHEIVRASAGTGKTFRLSSRYLRLLDGEAPPTHILATTFTRKAAGEILDRVLRRLAEGARDQAGAADVIAKLDDPRFTLNRCRLLLHNLCRSLHVVSISTLDSFFHGLGRCFHLELDLPPDARMIESTSHTARQIRLLAIEAMLADDDPTTLVELLRRVLHDTTQRRVSTAIEELIDQLHGIYRQTPAEAWQQVPRVAQANHEQVAQLISEFRDVLIESDNRKWPKRLVEGLQKLRIAIESNNWPAVLSHTIAQSVFRGDCTYYKKPLDLDLAAAIDPLVQHAFAVNVNTLANRTEAMHDLLKRYDAHDTRLRREHRIVYYDDLPLRLASDLPEMHDIYYRLDSRIDHLMLDEFQDTSVLQWNVLRPLAEEIAAVGDMDVEDIRDAERTFFCVGDIKQAIYGWRGGCAAIFNRVEQDLQLTDASLTTMHKSFRSTPVVLDTVNQVFASMAASDALAEHSQAATQWQNAYQEHEAYFTDMPGYASLQTTLASDDDSESAERDSTHIRDVVDHIAQMHNAAPKQTIGVLVTKNKVANQYLYHLRQRGLPASGEGNNPITDDAAVRAVLSAMLLADHPGATMAAFHLLHTPLGRVVGIEGKLPDAAKRQNVAASIRGKLLQDGYATTITQWSRAIAPHCNRRNVMRLMQLIELADAYDADISLRCSDFVDHINAATVEEPTRASIRVMTVHKSKGLEFDVVVLPDLSRKFADISKKQLLTWRRDPTEPPAAVFPYANQNDRDFFGEICPLLIEAYQQESDRRLEDYLCALYVSMTRPRHALRMFLKPLTLTKTNKISSAGHADSTTAALLREQLSEIDIANEHLAGGEILYERGNAAWAQQVSTPADDAARPNAAMQDRDASAPLRIKLRGTATPAGRRYWPRVSPSSLEKGGTIRASDLLNVTPNRGMARGTIMHKWFEQIAWLDDAIDRPTDEQLRAIAYQADTSLDDATLAEALASFTRSLQFPAVREALKRPGPSEGALDLWRERPFAVQYDQQLLSGTFDRVTVQRDAQGRPVTAHLIDFKTDRVSENGDNLDELVSCYAPQIEAYRKALMLLVNLPESAIQASLLFVGSGVIQTV